MVNPFVPTSFVLTINMSQEFRPEGKAPIEWRDAVPFVPQGIRSDPQ